MAPIEGYIFLILCYNGETSSLYVKRVGFV